MQTVTMVAELRQHVSVFRQKNEKIVFVPTMGNLHAGHLALVERAKYCGDKVVCSIFINALQFDREADLQAYPRTPQQDLAVLQEADVDIAFMPAHEEIYSEQTKINVPKHALNQQLCGKCRPGFFDGIVEVVARLFYMVKPDVAVFGEKDYQQLVIIKQLVQDLELPIQIEQVPTQRETDGLALSSRNSYLNEAERKLAPQLYAVLVDIKEHIEHGCRDFESLEKKAVKQLSKAGLLADYVVIRDANNLDIPRHGIDFIAILAAAWLGKARLIDNVLLHIA